MLRLATVAFVLGFVCAQDPIGRCCGTRTQDGLEETFCFGEIVQEVCEDTLSGTFQENTTCTDACPGVSQPNVETSDGRVVSVAVNASNAGAGFTSGDAGVSFSPIDPATIANLPVSPDGTPMELVFRLNRYLGTTADESGFLGESLYLLVTLTSSEPAFTGDETLVIYRLDEDTNEWTSSTEDCASQSVSVDNTFDAATSSWTVAICHTSDFGALDAAADAEDKKPTKASKEAKKPKKNGATKPKGKPAKTTPSKDTAKTSKDTAKTSKQDPKGKVADPKAKDAAKLSAGKKDAGKVSKAGKKATAIGLGVAGGVVAMIGTAALVRIARNRRARQTKGRAETAVINVSV